MNLQKIEEFAKKHTVLLIAGGGALIIGIILIVRSRGSNKATLETIHEDLAQIDFDINMEDSDIQALNNFAASPTSPVSSTVQTTDTDNDKTVDNDTGKKDNDRKTRTSTVHSLPSSEPVSAPVPVPVKRLKRTSAQRVKTPRHAPRNVHPRLVEHGAGIGGFTSTTSDPWAEVETWSYVGQEDYRTMYDTEFIQEIYGIVDNFSNSIRLN